MACRRCEMIEHSHSDNPFIPPQGKFSRFYTCSCGQKWWCFNLVFNLWGKVNDDATWENVSEGCPRVVSVGSVVKLAI